MQEESVITGRCICEHCLRDMDVYCAVYKKIGNEDHYFCSQKCSEKSELNKPSPKKE